MKILVTGANGFIGRHLVSRWSDRYERCEVFAVVREARQVIPTQGITIVEMDLQQPLDIAKLPSQIDVVIHLAQANVRFPEAANQLFGVNTSATLNLLEYARSAGARQFILASSGDVYGKRTGPCRETDCVAPASFYGVTKYAAELLVFSYSNYLLPCVLRLFQPYGPGQSGRLIPKLEENIRRGNAIKLHNEASPQMTPIYIDDVTHAVGNVIDSAYSGILNLAGERTLSMRELAEEIGKVIERQPLFEDTGEDASDLIGDNSLMKQNLGSWNMVSLVEGLSRTFKSEEANS
jgi:nucleoside-diphosphate-sugar epimerase